LNIIAAVLRDKFLHYAYIYVVFLCFIIIYITLLFSVRNLRLGMA